MSSPISPYGDTSSVSNYYKRRESKELWKRGRSGALVSAFVAGGRTSISRFPFLYVIRVGTCDGFTCQTSVKGTCLGCSFLASIGASRLRLPSIGAAMLHLNRNFESKNIWQGCLSSERKVLQVWAISMSVFDKGWLP